MNDALFRPSSMLRRKLCPGSLALESTLPTVDDPNEFQEQGTRLHALVADPSLPRDGCSPSELELIESVEKSEAQFTALGGRMQNYQEFVERQFSFHWNGEVLFVGHPDRVRIYPSQKLAICSDYKFGFKEVQSADANLQLRCYLAMIAEEYPVENYYGAIYQPRVSSRSIAVHYTRQDIEKARLEIKAIFDACYAENAPRRPSPQACEFCNARLSQSCPEHISWINAVQTVGRLPVSAWTDEQMEIFESRRSAAIKFIDDVHEQIKKIKAANPDRLPGWELRPGAEVRRVTDLVRAWTALQSHMSAQQFSDQCDVSIGGLEDLLYNMRKNTPQKISQKEARRLINQLLEGIIEKRRNKPSLVKDE